MQIGHRLLSCRGGLCCHQNDQEPAKTPKQTALVENKPRSSPSTFILPPLSARSLCSTHLVRSNCPLSALLWGVRSASRPPREKPSRRGQFCLLSTLVPRDLGESCRWLPCDFPFSTFLLKIGLGAFLQFCAKMHPKSVHSILTPRWGMRGGVRCWLCLSLLFISGVVHRPVDGTDLLSLIFRCWGAGH